VANPIYSEMLHSFNSALKSAKYQVVFGEYGHSVEHEEELVEAVLSRRPDGILLTGVRHSSRCRRMLIGAKVPVVEIWDMTETPIDLVVGFSHDKVGSGVADYAVRRGYRSFGVITADDQRALLRMSGFENRVRELTGKDVSVYQTSFASLGAGREGLAELRNRLGERPLIFCSSDVLAHGGIIEAQVQSIRIPEDLAIVGFGDQQFARHTFPALSSVQIDRQRIGRHAAEALLERIARQTVKLPSVDVGFDVVERETS
jgi:LacI family gluconate utilization system Gnt-I transcriptional repressor